MSDLLSIGASGARAYQRALATVSNNISNAENPNYVRRDLRLTEVTNLNGIDPYHNYQPSFGGVDTRAVARSADPILESNVRLTGASLYGAETRSRWMGEIETALGDNEHGARTKLARIFTAGEELAAAPFDTVLRSQFLAAIDDGVTTIKRTANGLNAVANQIREKAQQETEIVNQALSALAKTNISLRGASEESVKQAALLDERDTALAVITERIHADIDFGPKGTANISYDGRSLIDVGNFGTLTASTALSGELQLAVDGVIIVSPLQGSLSGLTSSASTNLQRQQEIDDLASQLVGDLNGWNASGETDGNVPGGPILAMPTNASSLVLLNQSITDLALAQSGGALNGNILNLANLRGSAGAEQAWTNIIGAQAISTASAQSEVAATKSQNDAARQARDSLSSVDLDREAADLIRFQQAYDASARVIQVARETMQSILAIF